MTAPEATPALPLPTIAPSDRLGAVVPAPDTPALGGADLTNVIVLAQRRNAAGIEAPDVVLKEDERPAPLWSWHGRTPWTALFAAALLLHLFGVSVFLRDPEPLPSMAQDSISVELVPGGQTEAGTGPSPGAAQATPSPPSDSVKEEVPPPETPQKPDAPDLRPRLESAEPQHDTPQPVAETALMPAASAMAEAQVAMDAPEPSAAPVLATVSASADASAPAQVEAQQPPPPSPEDRVPAQPRKPSKPPPSIVAASRSGVGVGSSRDMRNWTGHVTALLARHKRYPADALARGVGGTARISFSVGSDGQLTAVRLVRSSGDRSIDHESIDLIRRAAPFPPPPNGRASITLPINYSAAGGL